LPGYRGKLIRIVLEFRNEVSVNVSALTLWLLSGLRVAGPQGARRATEGPGYAQTYHRERLWASSFLLRCCIRSAHSVSLIRPACRSRKAAVTPGFK